MGTHQTQSVDMFATSSTTGAQTATGSSQAHRPNAGIRTFSAHGTTSAGSGAATIIIEASNQNTPSVWITLGTITLTLGTTETADAFVSDAPYRYVRARISAISGTDATVYVEMGTH